MPLTMLEVDSDGVPIRCLHVCHDSGRSDPVAHVAERRDAFGDEILGLWPLATLGGLDSEKLGLARAGDRCCVRKELAARLKLVLRKTNSDIQELVQLLLRLRRCVVAPSGHGGISYFPV